MASLPISYTTLPTPPPARASIPWTIWRWCMESGWTLALAGLLFIYGYILYAHWQPAHHGVDQNGYLVGGRMLYEHGSMRLQMPAVNGVGQDFKQFVGIMWIGVDVLGEDERYYPKYPVGLPLIYAGLLWLFGLETGARAAFMVAPVCSVLTVLCMYIMLRQWVRPFNAIMGAALLGFSPAVLYFTNNPNSHASSLFFVTSGLMFLAIWLRRGGGVYAILAGLFMGYATTIRYTEGLLVLPVLFAMLLRWRPWRISTFAQPLALGIAFSIPIIGLLTHNLYEMGSLTGYDGTGESTGFKLEHFYKNWETMVDHMGENGLVFTFPLGVMSIMALLIYRWWLGVLLLLATAPSMAIYMFYYWAPDNWGFSYIRFFITIFPPLIAAICVMADHMISGGTDNAPRKRRFAMSLGMLALTTGSVAYGWHVAEPSLERESVHNANLSQAVKNLQWVVPEGSVLFCADRTVQMMAQFSGSYINYGNNLFDPFYARRGVRRRDDADAHPLDPGRIKRLKQDYINKSRNELNEMRSQVIEDALSNGRRVFYYTAARSEWRLKRGVDKEKFTYQRVLNGKTTAERKERRESSRRRRRGIGPSQFEIWEITLRDRHTEQRKKADEKEDRWWEKKPAKPSGND